MQCKWNCHWKLWLGMMLGMFVERSDAWACSYVDQYGRYRYVWCSYTTCCDAYSYINTHCCSYGHVGAIVGGVVGFVVFVSIVLTVLTCCCCACCPVYKYRYPTSSGVVITTGNNTEPLNAKPPSYGAATASVAPYQSLPAGATAYNQTSPYQV